MARDNSPKIRQRAQLERKQNQRASYDRVLIVSEGSKTEPLYFKEIKNAHRLQTANVEVHRKRPAIPSGSDVSYLRASCPRKRSWTHVLQQPTPPDWP
jgi:hypothetical protein